MAPGRAGKESVRGFRRRSKLDRIGVELVEQEIHLNTTSVLSCIFQNFQSPEPSQTRAADRHHVVIVVI